MARKTTGPTLHGVMGRWSIFRGKKDGKRVQASITKEGGQDFEMQRTRLALIYKEIFGRMPVSVSDADVIEFGARGVDKTLRYMRESRAHELSVGLHSAKVVNRVRNTARIVAKKKA